MHEPPKAPEHSGVTTPALQVEQLVRTYRGRRKAPPRRAVDNISITIAPGEWVALLGPNGSGKSTLVRMLTTLDKPDEGRVIASGRALSTPAALAEYRRSLGVVFQHAGLDKLLTVHENLAAQAALHGLGRQEGAQAIARVADMLKVTGRLHDRIGTLSGGLVRRCDLARALLPEPRLLILDEATTGLDHDARMGFLDQLTALRQSGQPDALTIVMTTHLMDEAERADRVVMLYEGRVVLEGRPSELREQIAGTSIRCDASSTDAEKILENAGIPATVRGRERVARAGTGQDTEAVARVAASLARAGVAFEIAPPTLGDAYLAATGATLTDTDGDAA